MVCDQAIRDARTERLVQPLTKADVAAQKRMSCSCISLGARGSTKIDVGDVQAESTLSKGIGILLASAASVPVSLPLSVIV